MKYVFNRIEEHIEVAVKTAIPQGFSSTNAIFHCRIRSDNKALSPQQRRCGTTGKQPAIGNANIAQTLANMLKKTSN